MSTTISDETQDHAEPITAFNSQDGVEDNGIVYRVAQYVPRRSWRTWLIGRHLANEDSPHQTICKAIGFPVLAPWRVPIAVAMVIIIMLINLRGVKESGVAFAIPTYFFVVIMFLTVGIGLARYVTGGLGLVPDPPPITAGTAAVSAVGLF